MVAIVTAVAFGVRESVMSNKHSQSVAADQAAEMRRQAAEYERQMNLANRKKPNLFGITASNRSPVAGGTMLTGAQGIDPSRLTIGKTSLLGG